MLKTISQIPELEEKITFFFFEMICVSARSSKIKKKEDKTGNESFVRAADNACGREGRVAYILVKTQGNK